jgi:hypothetical protein
MPWHERINPRLIVFLLLIGGLVGYPLYVAMDFGSGIKHRADGSVEVDLKTMSNFIFDQTAGTLQDVPEPYRQLDGKKVILEGEMWDSRGAGGRVNNFDLVYSIAKCCFSGPPQVQHFVKSSVQPGREVRYYANKVRVTGTLKVDVVHDPETGKVAGVYFLVVESVEPA